MFDVRSIVKLTSKQGTEVSITWSECIKAQFECKDEKYKILPEQSPWAVDVDNSTKSCLVLSSGEYTVKLSREGVEKCLVVCYGYHSNEWVLTLVALGVHIDDELVDHWSQMDRKQEQALVESIESLTLTDSQCKTKEYQVQLPASDAPKTIQGSCICGGVEALFKMDPVGENSSENPNNNYTGCYQVYSNLPVTARLVISQEEVTRIDTRTFKESHNIGTKYLLLDEWKAWNCRKPTLLKIIVQEK